MFKGMKGVKGRPCWVIVALVALALLVLFAVPQRHRPRAPSTTEAPPPLQWSDVVNARAQPARDARRVRAHSPRDRGGEVCAALCLLQRLL